VRSVSVLALRMAFSALVQRLKSTSCRYKDRLALGDVARFGANLDVFCVTGAEHFERSFDAWFTSVLCRVMPRGRANACTVWPCVRFAPAPRPSIARIQSGADRLSPLRLCVADSFAHRQGIGDLMCDAGGPTGRCQAFFPFVGFRREPDRRIGESRW